MVPKTPTFDDCSSDFAAEKAMSRISSRDSLIEASSLSSQSNLPPVISFAKFIAELRRFRGGCEVGGQIYQQQTSNALTEGTCF